MVDEKSAVGCWVEISGVGASKDVTSTLFVVAAVEMISPLPISLPVVSDVSARVVVELLSVEDDDGINNEVDSSVVVISVEVKADDRLFVVN